MFQDPPDSLPLPPRPNLEQYRKLAKELVKACESNEQAAIESWARRWIEHLAALRGVALDDRVAARLGLTVRDLARFAESRLSGGTRKCALADAQFVIARSHGFDSWPKLAVHVEAIAHASNETADFEAAVDAIVAGDEATLRRLLQVTPDLVRARSTRVHRGTLLHYVSANGVEDYRQKTPQNIVEIARLLLESGADVNAESDAYEGRSTVLGLTATSWHPEGAGVQRELMELLIEQGAVIDGPAGGTYSAGGTVVPSAVVGCLQNGRKQAAEFFASRGAHLDLEGAAGVGRLDVVQRFFDGDGRLKPTATVQQMRDGFAWACEFGRTDVVDFLLQRGMTVDARLKHHGQTGLHWAAYSGHLETVKLLLDRGAAVDAKDEAFGGTPLGWALYGWGGLSKDEEREPFYEVVASLVRADAILDRAWYADDEGRRRALEKAYADPRMRNALAVRAS